VLACALALVVTGVRAGPVSDAERLAVQGDRDGAATLLRDALPTLTGTEASHAMYRLATLTRSWAEAESLHTALLDGDRQSAWAQLALIELGEHALLAANASAAHDFFDEAALHAAAGEVREQALLRDAQALLLMDQPGEARVRLNRLLDEEPAPERAERARLLLATVAQREGAYAEALRLNLELIGADRPHEPAALLGAARALLARGEGPLALEYLEELTRGYPDTASGAIARVLADSLHHHVIAPSPVATVDTLDAGPAPSFESTRKVVPPPGLDRADSARWGVDPSASAWPPEAREAVREGGRTDRPSGDRGASEIPVPDRSEPGRTGTPPADTPPSGSTGEEGRPPAGWTRPDDAPGERDTPPPAAREDDDRSAPREADVATEDGEGGYYVQLGAFANRIGALTTLSRLRRGGVDDAEIERVEVDGRRVYRVRVGPYPTRADAEAERAELEEAADVEGSFVRRSDR
jgi:cell division septation protein DedD